jgi:glycosyltransferase involved in cell wall biosynthesis
LSRLRRGNRFISFESVVVDGGSTDNTVQKARLFADKVYRTERGISKARNLGAKRADSEMLLFLDADVETPPDVVERILEVFKDSKVVGATCKIMPARSGIVEHAFFHFYNGVLKLICKVKPHSRGEFLVVRKKAFFAVEGFNEDLPCLEDHDLAYRLSKVGKFVFINDLTVYESMRRFRKLGISGVVGTWFVDYLFFLFRGKPLSTIWKPVR